VLRLHFPRIEPDVQIARIRLSDKDLMPTHGRSQLVTKPVRQHTTPL